MIASKEDVRIFTELLGRSAKDIQGTLALMEATHAARSRKIARNLEASMNKTRAGFPRG